MLVADDDDDDDAAGKDGAAFECCDAGPRS